jgi:hypothetical protein|tara:strand:+ start:702 stop:1343 length:642 start_codon:yes stop_codon:yes gene_type:complete
VEFTLGIITGGNSFDLLNEVFKSIQDQYIDKSKFEVVIVGGEEVEGENVTHVPFDESSGKYTAKKNLITKFAKFENVVYLHDYMALCDGWYEGYVKFGNDWDICMNVVENSDGSRFRDWCAWDDPELCYPDGVHNIALPSYDYNKTHYMYISGNYWVSKKRVMEEEPLNEDLDWGEAEDVEWSNRIRDKYQYVMNTHSKVKCLKDKKLSARYV